MREALFRGKRIDNGQWVYGFYAHELQGGHFILADEGAWYDGPMLSYVEVIPETVGQYTGLDDKNDMKIFEGDVVTASWYDYEEPREDTFGEVIFNEGWCSYCIWNEAENVMSEMNGQGAYAWEIEVIGNIHDNPEVTE